LGVVGPLLGTAAGLPLITSASAAPAGSTVPDWPAAEATSATPDWPVRSTTSVPDWPAGPDVPGAHVVVRGDCLWHIAAGRLLDELGRPPSNGEVTTAVQAWWAANADVIGPDPDLLLPGQVLRPPGSP
jgi:nucleoid-associated protein YgaU